MSSLKGKGFSNQLETYSHTLGAIEETPETSARNLAQIKMIDSPN